MTKGSFITLSAVLALTIEPVTAGMSSSGLSDADTSSIKRLGVISALGDTLVGRSMGLTVFNNKTFKATLPNRDLDASFTTNMKTTIAASGKIRGKAGTLITPALDTESILAAAREQGFDARGCNAAGRGRSVPHDSSRPDCISHGRWPQILHVQ